MPNLLAQKKSSFITIADTRLFPLNDSVTQKIEKLKKIPVYRKIKCIRLGKITDHLIANNLHFNIPDKKGEFKARVTEFKYMSENDFVWKGDLTDGYGNITIICENGKTFGHIIIENQDYEMQDVDGNTLFIEFDDEYISKNKSLDIEIKRNESDILCEPLLNTSAESLTCTGLVRILVLYTPAAQNSVANIFNTATLAINQLNDALMHSGISKSQLTTTLAAVKFIDFKETTNTADDIEKIGKSPVAMQLRSQYQADLVVILTGAYSWILGGSLVGPPVWSHEAYNIVEAVSATTKFTFAHEVAHLFGCRHEVSSDPSGIYEHGYQFTSGWWLWKKYWRTIMHVHLGDGDWVRVNHFSNPNVEHYNNPTGVANKNDNARKLRETSCIIENLLPYSGSPFVTISGPTSVSDGGAYTWYANVQGGSSPFSYLWEITSDGTTYNYFGSGQYVSSRYPFVNYNNLSAITPSLAEKNMLGLPQDETIYHLRVRVTDSKQESAYDYITIYSDNALPPLEFVSNQKSTTLFSNEKKFQKEGGVNFFIYPNPSQDYINVIYHIENPCKVQITILSSLGQTVRLYEIDHTTFGEFTNELKIDQLNEGIYFVNVILGNKIQTHKLIINR